MLRNNGRHNFRSPYFPQPSLVLDFAGTGTLDPRVTFTRSKTGTYYNSSGVLTTAAIDAPRFDYNPSTLAPLGLLIEQSSTNLELYSGAIGGTGWTNIRLSANLTANIAPDGTQTASLLTEDTSTNSHLVYNATALNVTNATSYTVTRYAKQAGRTWLNIVPSFSAGSAYFDLANVTLGTVTGGTATITSVGNGWCKCTFTVTSNTTTGYIFTQLASANGTNTYTGNGYSGIYIWGAQSEALAFPTSYIPTTSAQVTRAADNASMTGTNFSSWFNQGQGTVYSEIASFTNFALGSSRVGWQIDSGSGVTDRFVYNQTSSAMTTQVGGTTQANFSIPAPSAKAFTKNAFSYSPNLFNDSYNGTALSTITSGSIPTVSRLILGDQGVNSLPLNGWIKKFSYYPIQFTSAQNQALTGS